MSKKLKLTNLLFAACAGMIVFFCSLTAEAQLTYLEQGGVVVGEGEHFSSRVAAATPQMDNWLVVPDEDAGAGSPTGARGRYVQSLPDQAGGGGGPNVPPEIQYQVAIQNPGTYQLYVRWAVNKDVNNGGNADSMFADIVGIKDGPGGQADHYELGRNSGTFDWDGGGQAEVNVAGPANNAMTWNLAAGTHTLRFSQREDGSAVDAFVLQDSSLPAPTGFGPATSFLQGQEQIASLTASKDSYVRLGGGQNDQNFGASNILFVKDSGGGSTTRKAYISFDVTSLQSAILENAQLDLEVALNNSGGSPSDPTPNTHTINVYGLNDGVGDDWVEGSNENPVTGPTPPNPIVWDNAPANAGSNNIDLSEATFLGQFGVPALNPALETDPILVSFNNLMSAEEDALLDFLAADMDGVVTFILTNEGGSANLQFASIDSTTMMGPTLQAFGVVVPEPASIAIWSLLGLSAMGFALWRRRRT